MVGKLVTNADTDEEEFQAFENLFALSRGLKVPYLYLINGKKIFDTEGFLRRWVTICS